MTDRHRVAVLAVLLVVGVATTASPAHAGLELWVHETEFLKLIYYTKEHEYVVPHLARCFENSLRVHRGLFDYTPSEKIVILLHDFGDYGHGGTSTVPWNYVTIGLEPFDYVYETMPANERMNWLMHHELVHVVATDKGAGPDDGARKFFAGKVAPTTEQPISMFYSWLSSPRWYSPRWYHEGIAVFLETWMAGGMGRVLGGYDEMVFRTMVLEDRYFYDIVGLESEGTTIDFQVGQNSYLYGTRFVTWLGLAHGPEKLLDWFDRDEESRRYFSGQFEQVYGMSLSEAWAEWIEWERGWQVTNLERVREYDVTTDTPLSPRALGSVSRSFYDREQGRILAAVNYPGKSPHIAAIDLETGKIEKLANVSGPALYYVSSLAFDPAARKLFFTTDNSQGWRDLNELDLATGKKRRLVKDARAGNLVVHPIDAAVWAVQHHNGFSSIVRFPEPYEGWETLLTLPYGKDVFDLDISPDGRTMSAAIIEVDGKQELVKLDVERLRRGDGTYDVLYDFGTSSPANFVFSPDGRYLVGSSYYSGVSNLFRYDLESGTLDALTNAETGYFRPLLLGEDEVFAYRYSADGFKPVRMPLEVREDVNAIRYLGQEVVNEHPVVKTWNAGSPLKVDLEEATLYSGEYESAGAIRFASWYPVVEGYRSKQSVGARFNFADPVGLHSLDVTAGYSPDGDVPSNERYHLAVNYNRYPWKLRAGHNRSDFYDLFGPTKTSRKGTYFSAQYESYLINERPRTFQYSLAVAGFTGIDRLPLYQNIVATVDEYASFFGSLNYRNQRGTIGGVEAERGVGWDFGAVNNYVDNELLSQAYTNLDYGIPLPLDHSSIWLRASTGWSWGEETNTFSNFYFGGFGNNYVDHRAVRRYREFYSFPGLELNELEANNYGKLLIEWTLPPIRFRDAGVPGFYFNWAQFTLFGSGIVANYSGTLPRRELANAGAQLDFKLVMFSTLESTLSFGYAFAFEDGRPRENEFMASLKLLR